MLYLFVHGVANKWIFLTVILLASLGLRLSRQGNSQLSPKRSSRLTQKRSGLSQVPNIVLFEMLHRLGRYWRSFLNFLSSFGRVHSIKFINSCLNLIFVAVRFHLIWFNSVQKISCFIKFRQCRICSDGLIPNFYLLFLICSLRKLYLIELRLHDL